MKILFVLLFLSNMAYADQLQDFCLEREGVIFKKYKCPKTKLTLPIRTCEFKSEFGDTQFVNGCSGPSGGHKEIFFKACVKHDLCYHHEPSTNGQTRKDCDQLFLKVASKSCELEAKNKKKCLRWAKRMYRGLRVVGGPAYHCADHPSNY